jgi:hypothetical protein
MKRMLVFLASLLGVLVIVGCSSTTATTGKAASAACSADAECTSGACLELLEVAPDGGCSSAGKACSKTCTNDTDCTALGAGFKCFGGCGTTKICGATL